MPLWLQAGAWGLVAGAALLVGAAVDWFARVPRRWVAGVMAFGSGVLISALAFDSMDDAADRGGLVATLCGSGLAIALGALLDGIPESMVIGVSLLEGGRVSLVTVAAVFLSGLVTVAGFVTAFALSRWAE